MNLCPDPSLWHVAPWFFLLASFACIGLIPECKRSRSLALAFVIILIAHHAVAVCNALGIPIIGADLDAIDLHNSAVCWAQFSSHVRPIPEVKFYSVLMGIPYRFFGASIFLGSEITIFIFLLFCWVFLKIFQELRIGLNPTPVILFIGLSPATVVWTSVTLRESFQLFFFATSIFLFLRFRNEGSKIFLLGGLAAGFGMGFLQHGLMLFLICFIPMCVIWSAKGKMRNFLASGSILSLLFVWFFFPDIFSGAPSNIFSGEFLSRIKGFRENLLFSSAPSSAFYGGSLSLTDPISFLFSLAKIVFFYLFKPFPWDIKNLLDVYGFFEAFSKAVLFILLFLGFRDASKEEQQKVVFLLSIYLAMTLLWAVGTVNYGTALRHHIIHNWILIFLGVSGASRIFHSPEKEKA